MNTLKPFAGNFVADHLRQSWTRMSLGTYNDWNHYGTKGMFAPFAWGPWRFRGAVEAGSQYRPGIRCASVSDAWRLYYGLTRIVLADVTGKTSGVPRWQASGAGEMVCTRRADPDLWLAWNHVDRDDGGGGVYQEYSRPPEMLVTHKDVKRWDDLPPVGREGFFMEDVYDWEGNYDTTVSRLRLWPWWYAETQGGVPTGAVHLVVANSFSGRYYRGTGYFAIQCYLGCQRYYYSYEVQPRTFVISKQACGVSFQLYGCYFATKLGSLGLATPLLTDPQKRFEGSWC